MKICLILCLFFFSLQSQAHLTYIHLDQVAPGDSYKRQIEFLQTNYKYYNHFEPEWKFPVKKNALISQLKDCYSLFSGIHYGELESDLLLGEIGHYLYNLDVREFFDSAQFHYQHAIQLAPEDYRGYWFLAQHYSLSSVLDRSVEFYKEAQDRLPGAGPSDFWEEYSVAMLLVDMPSHCLMGFDKVRKILGKPGYAESQLGVAVNQKIVNVDPEKDHTNHELWTASESGDRASFTCRPLGSKLTIDTAWQVQLPNFTHRTAMVILSPAPGTAQNGKKIGYTIAIFMKLSEKDETLESYMRKLSAQQGELRPDSLHTAFKNIRSYEILNPATYPEWGGGHFHMIGFEQPDPEYPGLALEEPNIPHADKAGPATFRAGNHTTRFKGRIFYVIILDTCEAIHEESFRNFKTFLNEQMIVE